MTDIAEEFSMIKYASSVQRQSALMDEIERLRAALAQKAEPQEPDMRHPKIQKLNGQNARQQIWMMLVEQLVEDPHFDPTAMDMEHWDTLHDNLKDKVTALATSAAVPPGYALVPLEPTHDILCALTQEWHTSRHDAMTECPNCVTPWKCNGPHMTDDIPLPTEEIAAYWDIAYSEGDRNARYDTSDGSAQSALQDLQEAIRAYGDARAAAAEDKTRVLREALDLARNGLAWYIDMHPDEADDSDADTLATIDAAMEATK